MDYSVLLLRKDGKNILEMSLGFCEGKKEMPCKYLINNGLFCSDHKTEKTYQRQRLISVSKRKN